MKNLAWKQILITFAVTFVLGTLFGRMEFSYQAHHQWKDPEGRQQWILKRMDAKLHLNTEQEKQIAEILKEFSPKMHAVKAKMRPELDALRLEAHQRILPLLDAGQQKIYEQMEAERRERRNSYYQALQS